MVWYLVPGIALTLLACAIVAEFVTRNDSKAFPAHFESWGIPTGATF